MIKQYRERFHKLPLFTQAVLLLLLFIFAFGIFGPSMVSAKSTFAVWIGIGGCTFAGYILWSFSSLIREKLNG